MSGRLLPPLRGLRCIRPAYPDLTVRANACCPWRGLDNMDGIRAVPTNMKATDVSPAGWSAAGASPAGWSATASAPQTRSATDVSPVGAIGISPDRESGYVQAEYIPSPVRGGRI